MGKTYTVAVVSGTRADYGLLRPVLAKMEGEARLQASLIVTGAHLSADYGATVKEIEADGWPIAARLDILNQPAARSGSGAPLPGRPSPAAGASCLPLTSLESSHISAPSAGLRPVALRNRPAGLVSAQSAPRAATAARTALALRLTAEHLAQNRPDALLALGDRYEMLAAGQAAALLNIPVAHISGGDVTAGADDDWFRHCLTKLSKLHFPSCKAYRRRIIRMGEQPNRVFNVGGLGDENIRNLDLLDFKALAETLDFPLPEQYALVTFHPETALEQPAEAQAEELLQAVRRHPELFYLFTAAGADAGGEAINRAVAAFCESAPNAGFVQSLGVLRYLSAMKHAALVLGNSSSGVVETPSLGVPTVDVGLRQAGRETGDNVLHCALSAQAIADAMTDALDPRFAKRAREAKSPYNGGDTSGKIVSILADHLEKNMLAAPKIFYDGEDDV